MRKRVRVLAAAVVLGVSMLALGQADAPAGTHPAAATQKNVPVAGLVIEDADAAAQGAVRVDSVGIVATSEGPLAQTAITLTFKNMLNRPLEGNLEFPFTQGYGPE